MDKLIVMYRENKSSPENTWSGTSYALRKALEKYVDVIFIDCPDTLLMTFMNKVYRKLSRTCIAGWMGRICAYLGKRNAEKLLSPYPDLPVLEIANVIPVKNPFYLYHDMSHAGWIEASRKIDALGNSFSSGDLNTLSEKELRRQIHMEKVLFQKAEKVFYMGQWITEEMKQQYPEMEDSFVHVGGGLNRAFQVVKSDFRNRHQIVFVGIDYERKGGDLVLEAFRILKKTMDPEATLLIIGPEKRAQEDGVTWCGRLERAEIGRILSQSGVFCMPSRFEAYGLAFIEALCFGLPVIARDDYEMRYFVQNGGNGYLIKQDDAQELAVMMDRAIRNTKMQEYVQEHAADYLSEFSWDLVARKVASTIFPQTIGD